MVKVALESLGEKGHHYRPANAHHNFEWGWVIEDIVPMGPAMTRCKDQQRQLGQKNKPRLPKEIIGSLQKGDAEGVQFGLVGIDALDALNGVGKDAPHLFQWNELGVEIRPIVRKRLDLLLLLDNVCQIPIHPQYRMNRLDVPTQGFFQEIDSIR
eukprot:CAMPEP_0116106294 /NCGR_PEP_ID=MMETSP0327-20121206/15557_1 /TAXON_ID=44447 /ORGANISM="Pseudo-nitzschia delicatissima, Strain B596" /LENGTH=154 /DNA_ID=CAMNT_0003598893 /DNA_START=356 /DNA_END=820 /DNA_ORIENTATION=-